MNVKVVTIFPQSFPGTLGLGLIGKAMNKIWSLQVIDLKEYASRLDDRPFGGGNGMVLLAPVLEKAIEENNLQNIFFLSPRGQTFDQQMSEELSKYEHITLICGRYEGVDQRVIEYYQIREISIGDFILCGGESAALVVIESIIRNLPNVLGNKNSVIQESFSDFLLEHHHYTQPRMWKDISVPEILTNGHHKFIDQYRHKQSVEITKQKRQDLYNKYFVMRILKIIFCLYDIIFCK